MAVAKFHLIYKTGTILESKLFERNMDYYRQRTQY